MEVQQTVWILRLIPAFLVLVDLIRCEPSLQMNDQAPLTLSFTPPVERVELNAPLIIRCELGAVTAKKIGLSSEPGMSARSSMFLNCPIAPWGAFCFQNCQSACVAEDPDQCPYATELAAVICKTVHHPDGRIAYEYIVPNLTSIWFGNQSPSGTERDGFSCKTAGLHTPTVWLTPSVNLRPVVIENKPSVNTPPAIRPSSTGSTKKPPVKSTPALPDEPVNQEKSQLIKPAEERPRNASVARDFLIVVAIIIVSISVLLNLFCCLRCALIRQYSKSSVPVHMQHLFCMTEEIRNARLVRHSAARWKVEQSKERNGITSHALLPEQSDSTYLIGNSGLTLTNETGQPYGPTFVLGPAFMPDQTAGSMRGLAPMTPYSTNMGDNISVNATGLNNRYIPDGKHAHRQSGSGYSLPNAHMTGPTNSLNNFAQSNLISWPSASFQPQQSQQPGEERQQIQVATAVANFYAQQQQNLLELQQQLSSQNIQLNQPDQTQLQNPQPKQTSSSGGPSSGATSLGVPDNSLLEPYQPSVLHHHNLHTPLAADSRSIPNNQLTPISAAGFLNPTAVHMISQPPKTAMLMNDTGLVAAHQPASIIQVGILPPDLLVPWLTNRCQPMGSSQTQLKCGVSNSIPQLNNTHPTSSEQTESPPSQPDSISLGGPTSGKLQTHPRISLPSTKQPLHLIRRTGSLKQREDSSTESNIQAETTNLKKAGKEGERNPLLRSTDTASTVDTQLPSLSNISTPTSEWTTLTKSHLQIEEAAVALKNLSQECAQTERSTLLDENPDRSVIQDRTKKGEIKQRVD